MSFASPWFLLAVPLTVLVLPLLFWRFESSQIRRLERFATASLLRLLAPSPRRRIRLIRRLLIVVAMVALGLALARPRWGEGEEVIRQRGVDVVLGGRGPTPPQSHHFSTFLLFFIS